MIRMRGLAYMSLADGLAKISVVTRNAEISDAAYGAAKKMVLDTLGTMIAGHDAPGVLDALALMREWGGRPQSSVLVHGDNLPAPHAAFVNSIMAHALDYDDVHSPSTLHIMCSVLPASLAVGEMMQSTGEDLLAAIVVGVEAAARLGIFYNQRAPSHQRAHFLQSTLIGGFGATASASRLLGLNQSQTVSAIGINYAQSSGNRQGLYDKTLTKRLQPAFAARSALWSTMSAQRGITGPSRAFDGEAGLFPLYLGTEPPTIEDLLAPQDFWEIERVSVKPFPSCGAAHAITQAAIDLAERYNLQSNEVERVEVYLGDGGPPAVVGAPFEIGRNPQVNAQFSAAYCVALGLLRRKAGLAQFTDQQVRGDREVAELAQRVTYMPQLHEDIPWTSVPQGFSRGFGAPKVVWVHTRQRGVLRGASSQYAVLSPDAANWSRVVQKFRECCLFSGVVSDDNIDHLIEAISGLREAPSLPSLPLDSRREPRSS